jgi:hypothetical protein
MTDFAAAEQAHLIRVIKRKLKPIQYPAPSDRRYLPPTGLITGLDAIRPPETTLSTSGLKSY